MLVPRKDKFESFDAYFRAKEGLRCCIVMQHTPDPDAIGSAMALQWLLEIRYSIQSDIFYAGQVSHPQNQTEINVLDVHLKHKSQFDAEEYAMFVTVDAHPQNTGFDEIKKWDAVFDHHQFEPEAGHVDVRPVGSCASILWDYLQHFEVDWSSERGILIATALLFGLVNDTHDLLTDNVCQLDLDAHSNLIQYIDRKKFIAIVQHPIPPYLFQLKALAAENMVTHASILISYLGILSEKRRDALPIIADEFLRMEGVETVVVFCIIDGYIQASVRSQNSSVNVHQFCQRVFGDKNGGGKHGSGGAKVPIGFLYSPEDDQDNVEKLSEFVKDTISTRIIKHLSGA